MVSIHAPTRGATFRNTAPIIPSWFQSTHPRGVRLGYLQLVVAASVFQSTHPRGVRLPYVFVPLTLPLFQSTHPRGVRPCVRSFALSNVGFNPRTHEGCDIPASLVTSSVPSFNPRTHEGCDWVFCFDTYHIPTFQSTHPRGVRLYLLFLNFHQVSFNPRTHEGCDIRIAQRDWWEKVPVHAPTRGTTYITM